LYPCDHAAVVWDRLAGGQRADLGTHTSHRQGEEDWTTSDSWHCGLRLGTGQTSCPNTCL
jgi:hypothetical protein